MNRNRIGISLKLAIIIACICGTLVYFCGIPLVGKILVNAFSGCESWYIPWLIFLWITGIPCYVVLVIGWRIVKTFDEDRAFTFENSKRLRIISSLAICDTIFLILGNLIFLLLDMNHPGVLIISLGIALFGVAFFVVCQGLAILTDKAAKLQDQSDWTI